MKNILKFLFILPFFVACSDYKEDDINSSQVPEERNKYITGTDRSRSYSLTSPLPTFANETFHALGYGYDITGKYAHPTWIRKKVLDPQKFEDDHYYDVMHHWKVFHHRGLGTITGTREEVASQLLRDMKIKVDDILVESKNAFKGIFDTPFENDIAFTDINYYYALDAYASGWYEHHFNLFFDDDLLLLRDYLTDEFKSDLESKPANEIIKLYGTHVMVDIEVGWRQDYYYRSSSNEELQKRMVYTSARLLKSSPGIWMSPGPGIYYEKENLYTEYVSGIDPVGEPNAWMFDVTNYNEKLLFETRNHTIGQEDLVLINWGTRSHLGPIIPIYEFILDATKREALLQAYKEYLNK